MARIGMIAPITYPYPPQGYGPWERVTHDLTERLVEIGHDITLFAPAGSETDAQLVPTTDQPLICLPELQRRPAEDEHIRKAIDVATDIRLDLLHSHLHVHVLRYADRLQSPLLTTLHGAAWDRTHHPVLMEHAGRPYVSLSERERSLLPELNYVATIPNGIAMDDFPAGEGNGGYVVFVGRIAPEKAPHLAVEVARRSGRRLLIAGVVEDQYRDYAGRVLATRDGVEFVGHLERDALSELLAGAEALLMPLEWDEPFGLVVVEALASGTPVVAWRRGAMPEIVEHGKTGFLVEDIPGAVRALGEVSAISRRTCAAEARARFSDATMAESYGVVYERLLNSSPRSDRPDG